MRKPIHYYEVLPDCQDCRKAKATVFAGWEGAGALRSFFCKPCAKAERLDVFFYLKEPNEQRRKTMLPSEIVDDIIAYESGDLNFEEVVNLFQNLVDTGMAWSLQGAYGRTATDLLEEGLIQPFPRVEK